MSRRHYLGNVASNWVQMLWTIGWGIVMVPVLLSYLGPAYYGVWVLLNSVVGYYGLLDLGVHPAIVRHVSRSIGLGDRKALNEIFNTALVFQAGLGLCAATISVALAYLLPRIEGFALNDHPDARVLLLIVGSSAALTFIGSVFRGSMVGAERFEVANAFRMVLMLILNVGFIVALRRGDGLVGMAWVLLAVNLLEKPLMAIAALRFVPGLRISPRLFRRSRIADIFGYGIHAFAVTAGERLRFFTDAVVIGAFLPAEAITVFRVGSRPLQFLTNFVRGISRVLTPAFSRTEASSSAPALARLLRVGTRATALVATLGCLGLLVAGERLLRLWLGKSFVEGSVTILLILLPAYLIETALAPTGSVLLGTMSYRILSRIAIAEGVANLVLSLLLIGPFGLVGVALGTAIPMVVARLAVIPVYACRAAGLGYFRFLYETGAVALLPALGAGMVSVGLVRWLPGSDLVSVGLLCCSIVVAYSAIAFLVLRSRNDELLPQRFARSV